MQKEAQLLVINWYIQMTSRVVESTMASDRPIGAKFQDSRSWEIRKNQGNFKTA